ncbi:MAG: hypothetical protein M3P49_06880 [Actinomycetota bacterium]|nr:hypothetical protein [Actinomycetota bacterium]
MSIPSTVELYRKGEIPAAPYDLTDPLDRAIWVAIGLYVDRLDRRVLAGEDPGFREAWEVEEYLKDLAAHVRGERVMDYMAGHDTAQAVVEALFATGGLADPVEIPQDFWDAGDPEDQAAESALVLDRSLAVLSHMVRAALGELVSQSEAARRAGITKQSMAEKIARRGVPVVRVGRSVLVPVSALEALSR